MTTAEKIKGCGKEFEWDTNMPMICGEEYYGEVRLCDDCEGKMTTAEKFDLSKKIAELAPSELQVIKKEDVKEFIRLLKDWLSEQDIDHLSSLTVHNQIDKLAGEQLI